MAQSTRRVTAADIYLRLSEKERTEALAQLTQRRAAEEDAFEMRARRRSEDWRLVEVRVDKHPERRSLIETRIYVNEKGERYEEQREIAEGVVPPYRPVYQQRPMTMDQIDWSALETRTATGRMPTSGPNMQNVPRSVPGPFREDMEAVNAGEPVRQAAATPKPPKPPKPALEMQKGRRRIRLKDE